MPGTPRRPLTQPGLDQDDVLDEPAQRWRCVEHADQSGRLDRGATSSHREMWDEVAALHRDPTARERRSAPSGKAGHIGQWVGVGAQPENLGGIRRGEGTGPTDSEDEGRRAVRDLTEGLKHAVDAVGRDGGGEGEGDVELVRRCPADPS